MSQIQQFFTDLGPIGTSILNILAALAILVIGYVIARLAANVVRRLLARTSLDERIAQTLTLEETSNLSIEDIAGRVVFWIIMLFTAVGVLQRLELPAVADPINSLLSKVTTEYLPNLGGAVLMLIVAWAVATVIRFLITKATEFLKVDERLTEHGALEDGERVSVSNSLATAAFWFIFLLFIPDILSRLGMSEIAAPVQDMFSQAITYIPNIVGAGLILLIGWFIARILRQILTNLLAAVGADALGERAGLSGSRSLSSLVGTVVYTFILLFTIVSALEELSIEAISGPATTMLTTILDAVPGIFGASLVLIVSYYIARLVSGLISDLLVGIGVNEIPERLGISLTGTRTMSELIGYIIQVGIMLFAAISAAELLGSQFLANIITTFVGFAGQVILALIIFGIGLYLANLAHGFIKSAGGAQSQMTATIARMAILVLAGAMGLRQMGIADDIVNLAFGILLGALGVAAALAFGLGSREIAGQEVARLIDNIRSGDSVE
ncbi:MAG: mechanosensitive ion channel [Chloroflexota bacterium]